MSADSHATVPDRPAGLPPMIPAPTGEFLPTSGGYRLGQQVRVVAADAAARLAQQLADDLGQIVSAAVPLTSDEPRPGDVVLELTGDGVPAGYEVRIGDTATVSASTATGLLHGTKSLVQMLRQSATLPGGSFRDEPVYAERGLTICAGEIHISPEWIERVLAEMSYLKLNQALLPVKMLSNRYPQTRTWGYYSREQIAALVASAAAHGIDLVPQINAPGHMLMWIEHMPEMQLLDRHGRPDPMRLDISRPESLQFYTDLVDEYLEVFDSPHWHMGADEYMLHTSFSEYPQLASQAQQRWGPEANPDDLYIDFVNQVNRYVRDTHGKTLRIWNDGLLGRNRTVMLDRDVVVEHWTGLPSEPTTPSKLLADGYRVMNSSVDLYLTRGGGQMDTEKLYTQGWHVGQFHLEEVSARELPVTGAKVSLWPDDAGAQTENDVEEALILPLRFLAQATWSGQLPDIEFAEFAALGEKIGRYAPLPQRNPVPEGIYHLTVGSQALTAGDVPVLAEGPGDRWQLLSTPDGYYYIQHAERGERLEVVGGGRMLGVPLSDGAEVALVAPSDSQVQKWQIKPTETGIEIVNAITQQSLDAHEGALVQRPFDRNGSRWALHSEAGREYA